MRTLTVQILKAANIKSSSLVGVALQLKQLADDVYTGRTIPPNQGPLPILGSAGAYQAYIECQYMAALDLVKRGEINAGTGIRQRGRRVALSPLPLCLYQPFFTNCLSRYERQ